MSKKRSTGTRSRSGSRGCTTAPRRQQSSPPEPEPGGRIVGGYVPSQAAIRETIESIVVAFVLAFLFRTFEAEAFVIPTGSMAPTLMGRHKDLECPICGYPYRVSASSEVDPQTNALKSEGDMVAACTCPMCRYTMDLAPGKQQDKAHQSFKGDRILVSKFTYQFSEPQRWDVAVFKFPAEAKTNYIKRIVGLPNETLRIHHGDVFTCREGMLPQIERKPPRRLLAMLQPVYDNDFSPPIIAQGWPRRWNPVSRAESSSGGWVVSDEGPQLRIDGTATGRRWLRYEHRVPTYPDWRQLDRLSQQSSVPVPVDPGRRLIADFCAYNSNLDLNSVRYGRGPVPESFGLHWVGDLAVECEVEVQGSTGAVVFELIEGGRSFQCSIDVGRGEAGLSIEGVAGYRPTASTEVCGPGDYDIIFANVDDQLLLWVEGSLVRFDSRTTYEPLGNTMPDERDLSPVGIASDGAALKVEHLKILRDVYYITGENQSRNGWITDFPGRPFPFGYLSEEGDRSAFAGADPRDFLLRADQFLVLGDNSACSKDSRLWGLGEYYVSRELLIGKALFIYWPHSWHQIPGTKIPFPFFPNFPRIRFVR